MGKHTIEVELPDGYEPKPGQVIQTAYTNYAKDSAGTYTRPVGFGLGPVSVRPAWKWPEWLKAPYIAMDKDGDWFAYSGLPECVEWLPRWQSAGCCTVRHLSAEIFNFTPPPCDDWRQSLRKNPNL